MTSNVRNIWLSKTCLCLSTWKSKVISTTWWHYWAMLTLWIMISLMNAQVGKWKMTVNAQFDLDVVFSRLCVIPNKNLRPQRIWYLWVFNYFVPRFHNMKLFPFSMHRIWWWAKMNQTRRKNVLAKITTVQITWWEWTQAQPLEWKKHVLLVQKITVYVTQILYSAKLCAVMWQLWARFNPKRLRA